MTLPGSPPPSGRLSPPSRADLRRKAHARLADRTDPARSRHKPLSLVRQEARRLVEQFVDAEAPTLPKAERDALVDDVLAEAVGVSPLEELFRDETVKEVLVLAAGQVIARRGELWLPTSVRFRDDAQLRAALGRLADAGEPLTTGPAAAGGFDVRLANGFRAMVIVPPDVMGVPPMALFARAAAVTTPTPILAPPPPVAVVAAPGSGFYPAAGPAGPGSGFHQAAGRLSGIRPAAPAPPRSTEDSGFMARPPLGGSAGPESATGAGLDPLARVRLRVTKRIITQLAAAGVYDLNVFPLAELRKIVAAYVHEQCELDRLGADDATQERLAQEIIAGMNR